MSHRPCLTSGRRDSDEEPIRIDFTRPPSENILEFVWRACQREGTSRGQRLAYLNALVKVFSALDAYEELTVQREELIYWSVGDSAGVQGGGDPGGKFRDVMLSCRR